MRLHNLYMKSKLVSSFAFDWRLLGAIGLVLGVSLGLVGLLYWQHPLSLVLWLALLGGLGWAGWDVRPRQVGALRSAATPSPQQARRVQDGPFVMVELAGGSFLMGSPDNDPMARDDEKPRHEVRVSSFRIGRTPVTQGQWRAVTGKERGSEEDQLPVTDVSWEDALRFCNALSVRKRHRPCYRRVGIWPWRRWRCDWRADGYRLPTEAEWEYACRAGTDSPWSFGDDPELLGDYAWLSGNSDDRVHPVAEKRPNPWGLHDMHGNVWEWCWDRYGAYSSRPVSDPHGPVFNRWRVLRGGSFDGSPEVLRSAGRGVVLPEVRFRFRHWDLGFRCVRVPARQH